MYKKSTKRLMCCVMSSALIAGSLYVSAPAEAAKKATLQTKKMTLNVKGSKTLKIKNKSSKCKYSFASNKKSVAKVSKTGKVTGVKAGSAKITVKETNKKNKKKVRTLGTCKVVVKAAKDTGVKASQAPNVTAQATATPVVTATPATTPTTTPVQTPVASNAPDQTATPVVTPEVTEEPVAPMITQKPAYAGVINLVDTAKEYDGEVKFEFGEEMIYGGLCDVSITVKQESGSDKDVTVACDGKYMSFKINNGAYIDKNSVKNDTPMEISPEVIATESGKSVSKDFTFTVPKYSNDFNIVVSCEGKFTIEKMQIDTKPCNSATYSEMVDNSLLVNGNNARIKKAIQKARAGEDVTLAYLGGSITEGFAASETKNSDCYAETSYNAFKTAFGKGDGSNVHFINAGMSGTPSSLGIVRYQRDILNQMKHGEVPDILFIDFAVNDGNDDETTYESIIRTALDQGSAVVLMFVLYTGGCNHETGYSEIGKKYNLYMVSPGQGQRTGCEDKASFDSWFYWPDKHPDVGGHRYMADCIMNMFKIIENEDVEEDDITDVASMDTAVKNGDMYVGMKTLESNTDLSNHPAVKEINAGGFCEKDDQQSGLQYMKDGVLGMKWFPNAWAHTKTSGNESFTMKLTCGSLLIAYKQASGKTFGAADVYVDGVFVKKLKNSTGGWNNASIDKILISKDSQEHEVEIKMADGDESKPFTIFAIGYTE